MGLQKGEKIERLGLIKVVSVTVEPLSAITKEDVGREGFLDWSPDQFVEFFSSHNNIPPDTIVNRIEFCFVADEECLLEAEEIRMQIDDFWLHNEKTKKEIERIDTAVKHAQLGLDVYRGKYVLRTDMALYLEALSKELDRICKDSVTEMITLVGCNQQKAPELLGHLFRKKPCLLRVNGTRPGLLSQTYCTSTGESLFIVGNSSGGQVCPTPGALTLQSAI